MTTSTPVKLARARETPVKDTASSSARTSVAWQPKKNLARHEWLLTGRRLGGISRCNQWWLGDWVRYGTAKWGDKYTQVARVTGYDPRSLANMASISAAFEMSRRREDLAWSHHVAVAALSRQAQDEWLDRAAREKLSVADLRTELRAVRKGEKCSVPPEDRSEMFGGELGVVCPRCGHRFSS
jgi:hypothetical protein